MVRVVGVFQHSGGLLLFWRFLLDCQQCGMWRLALAGKEAFNEFLSSAVYTADQIVFINQIVEHLVHNGLMEPKALFEPPFTDMHDNGVVGVLPDAAQRVVDLIEKINANADVA